MSAASRRSRVVVGLAAGALALAGCNRTGATTPSAESRTRAQAAPAPLRVDTLAFGRFGQVVVYRRSDHPSRVVLFISGDGGWNGGVVRMAERLAGEDAAVVGIDIRRYTAALRRSSESCGYPAADFEALSQWLQRRLGYPAYTVPVLVGYSSGATLAYAVVTQAPRGTFRAAISLGFCPALALPPPLCRGDGLVSQPGPRRDGVRVMPSDSTGAPWIVLQGVADSACPVTTAEAFVRMVHGADLVRLPGVGHGFGVEAHWLPQFRDAFERVAAPGTPPAPDAAVRGLPLVELPGRGRSADLAIIVSGDGGWASLDRQIGETFAARGIPVVGLDALRYFWTRRTPGEMGRDLERIARHYLATWRAANLLLVGYSRGAEVLPFMVSRLPSDLRARIRIVALLAPERTTAFEFHLADWLGGRSPRGEATAPEIAKLRGLPVLCVYGVEERDSACPSLPADVAALVPLAGGHHFQGAYRDLAERVLAAADGRAGFTGAPAGGPSGSAPR